MYSEHPLLPAHTFNNILCPSSFISPLSTYPSIHHYLTYIIQLALHINDHPLLPYPPGNYCRWLILDLFVAARRVARRSLQSIKLYISWKMFKFRYIKLNASEKMWTGADNFLVSLIST